MQKVVQELGVYIKDIHAKKNGTGQGHARKTHKEIEGERAAEAEVAMVLGDAAANTSEECALDVVDVISLLHIAILLDGSHHLRVCQDLII